MRSNPNPAYNEFLIRLIGVFKDKDSSEIARIARASAPDICGVRTFNAVRIAVNQLREQTKRVPRKDIEIAKKLLKDLPKREVSEYDLAEMRLQTKPIRNK